MVDGPISIDELERRLAAAEERALAAEAALAASDAKLRQALEVAGMDYWEWHPDTDRVIRANTLAVFQDMPGQPKSHAGEEGFALIHPDDRERHEAMVRQAGRNGEGWHTELRVVRRDNGATEWIEERASPTRDPVTGELRIVGFVWNITKRKRAEAALRENDARHRLLIESWAQAVWESDGVGVVVEDSPSWRAYTGQTLDEWLGDGWLDAIHPDDRAYAERQWREAMVARSLVDAEFRFRAPGGSWRWTNVRAAPVLDQQGKIEKWAGINIDIDARKRAEAALRESEAGLAAELAAAESLQALSGQLIQDSDPQFYGQIVDTAIAVLGADFGSVQLLDQARAELCLMASRNFSPEAQLFWGRVSVATGSSCGAALGCGERVIIEDVAADARTRASDNMALWKEAGIVAVQSTPLTARDGTIIGMISTHWRYPHRPSPHELRLFDVLARQAADFVERARSERALRESEERKAFLLELADELNLLTHSAEMERAAVRMLGKKLGASQVFYATMGPDGDSWSVQHGFADGVPSLAGRYPLSDFQRKRLAGWQAGRISSVADSDADASFDAADRAAYAAIGARAAIGVPLVKGGRFAALLVVNQDSPRAWTDNELTLVKEVADRTWAAIERARAEEALRESEEKYRSLFDSIDEGFTIVELVRDPDGKPVDVIYREINHAFERVSGLTPAVMNRKVTEVLPQFNPDWFVQYARIAETGVPERSEEYLPDVRRWHRRFMSRIGGPGSPLIAIVFDDITDRKMVEAARRESEERQAFLLKLTDAVRPLESPADIQGETTRLLREKLKAGWCHYVDWDPDKKIGLVICDSAKQGHPSLAGTHDVFDAPEFLRLLTSGEVLKVRDYPSYEQLPARIRQDFAALGFRSMMAAPLVKEGRLIASLIVGDTEMREWSEKEASLLSEVAERTWAALERGRAEAALRERETDLARVQRIGKVGGLDIDVAHGLRSVRSPEYLRLHGLPQDGREETHSDWLARVHPDDRDNAERTLFKALKSDARSYDGEYRIVRPSDGAVRWIHARADIERDADGKAVRLVGAHADVTEQKRSTEALRESERWLQTLMKGVPQLVWRAVDGGHWTWASPQWTAFTGQPEADSHDWGWLAPVHRDDMERVKEIWAGAIGRGEFHADYRIFHAGERRYRWFQTRATPVRDSAGAICEWLGTSTDIDDLRQLQERQQILLAELQHRVRNILAITRSMISRSDDGERSTEEYVQHLQGRIAALARTQVLLTRSAGTSIDLEMLIRDELLSQVADEAQFKLEGEQLAISPKSAEVLTLAIHELATNATKYGAFSRSSGRLEIHWRSEPRAGQNWLVIDWREHGVPVVHAVPRRQGFGSELISRRIPYELKGHGSLRLQPGGIESRIEFPLLPGESILQTDTGGR